MKLTPRFVLFPFLLTIFLSLFLSSVKNSEAAKGSRSRDPEVEWKRYEKECRGKMERYIKAKADEYENRKGQQNDSSCFKSVCSGRESHSEIDHLKQFSETWKGISEAFVTLSKKDEEREDTLTLTLAEMIQRNFGKVENQDVKDCSFKIVKHYGGHREVPGFIEGSRGSGSPEGPRSEEMERW